MRSSAHNLNLSPGWSASRFLCWKKRSESVVALGVRDSRLRLIGQALKRRLQDEGVNHHLPFTCDITGTASTAEDTIFLGTLTTKALDAIIKEARIGIPLLAPKFKLDLDVFKTITDEPESKNVSTLQTVFRVSDLITLHPLPRQNRRKKEQTPVRKSIVEPLPNSNQDSCSLGRRRKIKHVYPPSLDPSCTTSNDFSNDDNSVPALRDILTSLVVHYSGV